MWLDGCCARRTWLLCREKDLARASTSVCRMRLRRPNWIAGLRGCGSSSERCSSREFVYLPWALGPVPGHFAVAVNRGGDASLSFAAAKCFVDHGDSRRTLVRTGATKRVGPGKVHRSVAPG